MGKRKSTAIERFWSKVRPEVGDKCWLWTGSLHGRYGRLHHVNGKRYVRAHRFSWELHFGQIPADMFVCHRCDTPACVRPDHLFIGTVHDNNRDSIEKGRAKIGRDQSLDQSGEKNCNARLTESQVMEIRSLYSAGGISMKRIGLMYGIKGVSEIVHGRRWHHLPVLPTPRARETN